MSKYIALCLASANTSIRRNTAVSRDFNTVGLYHNYKQTCIQAMHYSSCDHLLLRREQSIHLKSCYSPSQFSYSHVSSLRNFSSLFFRSVAYYSCGIYVFAPFNRNLSPLDLAVLSLSAILIE